MKRLLNLPVPIQIALLAVLSIVFWTGIFPALIAIESVMWTYGSLVVAGFVAYYTYVWVNHMFTRNQTKEEN